MYKRSMNSLNFFGGAADGSIIFTRNGVHYKLMLGPATGKPMVRPVGMDFNDEAFDSALSMGRIVKTSPNLMDAWEILAATVKSMDILCASLEAP